MNKLVLEGRARRRLQADELKRARRTQRANEVKMELGMDDARQAKQRDRNCHAYAGALKKQQRDAVQTALIAGAIRTGCDGVILAGAIHTICDAAALNFEHQFPCLDHKYFNSRDFALSTSTTIATTALHYTHNDKPQNGKNSKLLSKLARNVCGKYAGIKAVDLTVSVINGFTKWLLGRDMIDPDSKKTKLAQSVAGTCAIILLHNTKLF